MFDVGKFFDLFVTEPKYKLRWCVVLTTILVHLGMAIKVITWRILFNLPIVRRPFIKYMRTNKTKSKRIPEESFVNSMATYQAWLGMGRSATVDALKTTREGGPMVDVGLFHLDGTLSRLSQFMKNGRPLVINFGSCT